MEALRRNLEANHIDDDHYKLLLEDNQLVDLFAFRQIIIFNHLSFRHVLLVSLIDAILV